MSTHLRRIRPDMSPTKGISYTTLEHRRTPPRYSLLSPSGCLGTVASFTDLTTPIPVGGANGTTTSSCKAAVPATDL